MTSPGPWTADEYGKVWGLEHPKSKHANKRELIGYVVDIKGRHSSAYDGHIDQLGYANVRLITKIERDVS